MRRCGVGERVRFEQRLDRIPLRRRVGRADEQAAPRAFRRETRRAIDAARTVDELGELAAAHQIMGALTPERRPVVGREQRADAAVERDARPPGALPAARTARASARSRARRTSTGAIEAGVAFASGWPENGSVCGATSSQIRAAEAVSPFQWIGTNSEPRCWPSLERDLEDAFAMRGRDAREVVFRPKRRRIVRMDLDERLRRVLAEPRAQAACASWCATGRARGRC